VRLHAADWAVEAIETYGNGAEALMRYVEGGYNRAERYAFRQVRKAIRQQLNPPSKLASILATIKEAAIKGPTIGADPIEE
jgi:hypothetical protein